MTVPGQKATIIRMFLTRATLFTAAAFVLAGCELHVNSDLDTSVKRIRFTATYPDGSVQQVERFFNTGLSASGPASQAYDAVQMGQGARALQIMEAEIRQSPHRPWNHYNLGILYELAGRWADAHREVQEACHVDRPRGGVCNGRFRKEIEFTRGFLPR